MAADKAASHAFLIGRLSEFGAMISILSVRNTPAAAATTARLLIASLRERSQTERMFAAPVRDRYNITATADIGDEREKPRARSATHRT